MNKHVVSCVINSGGGGGAGPAASFCVLGPAGSFAFLGPAGSFDALWPCPGPCSLLGGLPLPLLWGCVWLVWLGGLCPCGVPWNMKSLCGGGSAVRSMSVPVSVCGGAVVKCWNLGGCGGAPGVDAAVCCVCCGSTGRFCGGAVRVSCGRLASRVSVGGGRTRVGALWAVP